jgi:hypothetical protein
MDMDGFTSEMYHGERVDLVNKIEERALMMNPDLRNLKKKKELGFAEPEAQEVPKGAEEEKVRGVVKQRSGKGTEYTRTYNKWDKQEELYLGTRLYDYKHGSVSLNDLKMSLKRISGKERTGSSIKTKMKRLGKHDIQRSD